MADYITISLKGKKFKVKREITEQDRKDHWFNRNQKTITETKDTTPAKIISPRLAVYKAKPSTTYSTGIWHVIHIPTGLVIAACEHDIIKDVKSSFESSDWTLKGKNKLVLVDDTIQFEMTCKLRYTIEKESI